MKASITALLAIAAMLLCTLAAAEPPQEQKVKLNIAAQSMEQALNVFAEQTGFQLLFRASEVPASMLAPRLAGTYTPRDALKQLLANTSLNYEFINARTVAIRAADAGEVDTQRTSIGSGKGALRFARIEGGQSESMQKVVPASTDAEKQMVESPAASEATDDERSKGIPEILVKGRRSLNTDIQRTEDAPQPYVVFHKEEIQRSQAVNLEDFLRTRLPMNTASRSAAQLTGNPITLSSNINLRGLGTNQTLILIDGRRVPGIAANGNLNQPDINGIPMAAIERIEVLPSTASGIYGGSATGGVINVILRRDFHGLEAGITYANTFDTDAANTRLDASAGFSLERGRTQVMIAATRSEANSLVIGDRDFAARAIALQRANNPGAVIDQPIPPLGATVNIRSAQVTLFVPVPAGTPGSISGLPLGTFVPGVTSAPNTAENPNFLAMTQAAVPLVLKDGTPINSFITHLPLGYAGPASDNGAALLANAGQYNLDLPGGVNGSERGLVAAPAMESVSLNVRREFGARLEAFLDLSRLNNKGASFNAAVPSGANLSADAPNNPFQQAIVVRFPTPGLSFGNSSESTTMRAAGGIIAHLPRAWMGETSYGWSRSRSRTVNTGSILDTVGTCVLDRGTAAGVAVGGVPCAQGDKRPALNALQECNTFPIDFGPYLLPPGNAVSGPRDTILQDMALRLSGPTLRLPGGNLTLSVLIARREERLKDSFSQGFDITTRELKYFLYPERSQNTSSYYFETRAPLISQRNARSFLHEFELQASVRRDEYMTRSVPGSANGSVPSRDGPFPALTYVTGRLESTDYTLGLRYMPLQDLALRASFGTGFLPPSVTQIAPNSLTASSNMGTDPRRGNTPMYVGVPFMWLIGGSPDLRPEHSESWSAGIIFTPRFAADFRLSIDYTRIKKVDEIQSPNAQFLLDNEDAFPGRIVRGANLAGDPPGWAGPITSFDATLINIARTSVEAYDIQIDYALATERFGEFHWYAVATRQPHYRNQVLPDAPVVDSVGFSGGPLEWRGNLGLNWVRGPLALNWNAQYYDSYRIYTALALPLAPDQIAARANSVLNQGSAMISQQVYHDLIATYRFDTATSFAGGLLANSEISFGIQNLFDKSPPILASTDPTSAGYSTYGDPRLRRYSLSIRKSFGN